MKLYLSAALCSILLAGCSSNSSTTDDMEEGAQDTVLTGVFVDSAVGGLGYSTETQSGVTNETGEFSFIAGESVTLSIGNLALPQALAMESLSPLDLFDTINVNDIRVINLSRLLQSLDVDGNPANGIEISEVATAASTSTSIDFSQDEESFENNLDVINLIANSGSANVEIVSSENAIQHLQNTLATSGDLQSLDKFAFSNLISGNTFVFSAGSSIYYREDGAKFSRRQNGDEFLGTWSLVDGLVCEQVRGGESDFCIADSEEFIVTKHPDSDVYYYSEPGFSSELTITTGDTLSLASAGSGDLETFDAIGYTNLVIGNTVIYSEGQSYYYRADNVRFARETDDLENIVETAWNLDDSGAICEVTTSGDMFCPADVSGFVITKDVGSEIYNYSDDTFMTTFTVSEGDSLSLSN